MKQVAPNKPAVLRCPYCGEDIGAGLEVITPRHRLDNELKPGDNLICRACMVISVINPDGRTVHAMTEAEFRARGPSTQAKLRKIKALLMTENK